MVEDARSLNALRTLVTALSIAVASCATATGARADAVPNLAFDQLDLPIQCEKGCPNAVRGPGSFDADYARFVKEHPDYSRAYTPGLLYHVALFNGWTRVETAGIVTICNPSGSEMTVLVPATHSYYTPKALHDSFSGRAPGCHDATQRDFYKVQRVPNTNRQLPAISVDGITATGHSADYTYAFDRRRLSAEMHDVFRITTYTAAMREPCPAPRALPAMAIFGNTCGGDKRFLVFRTSVTQAKAEQRPAFVRGGMGILDERGHFRRLSAAGDLFGIPAGYRDACARGGRDSLGLCPNRRFHAPSLLPDKD